MIIRRSTEAKTYTVVIITERSAVRVVSGKELTWCSVGQARAGAMLCHFQIDAAFLVAENRIAAAMIDLQTLRLHFAVTITSSRVFWTTQSFWIQYRWLCVCAKKIKTWATECVFEPVLKSSNVCDWHLQEIRQRWCKQGGFSAILFGKIKFSLLKVYQQAQSPPVYDKTWACLLGSSMGDDLKLQLFVSSSFAAKVRKRGFRLLAGSPLAS